MVIVVILEIMEVDSGSLRRVRKTVMELNLILSPFLLGCSIISYPVLYFLDLNIPFLIISSFPAPAQNPLTITICLVLEMILHSVYIVWMIYLVFVLISFPFILIEWSRREVKKIRHG